MTAPHGITERLTDPAGLKVLLQVRPGMGPDYDWVTCNGCGGQWQVPFYAESVG